MDDVGHFLNHRTQYVGDAVVDALALAPLSLLDADAEVAGQGGLNTRGPEGGKVYTVHGPGCFLFVKTASCCKVA